MNAQELAKRKYAIIDGALSWTIDGERYTKTVCPHKSNQASRDCGVMCPLFTVVYRPKRTLGGQVVEAEYSAATLGCTGMILVLELK